MGESSPTRSPAGAAPSTATRRRHAIPANARPGGRPRLDAGPVGARRLRVRGPPAPRPGGRRVGGYGSPGGPRWATQRGTGQGARDHRGPPVALGQGTAPCVALRRRRRARLGVTGRRVRRVPGPSGCSPVVSGPVGYPFLGYDAAPVPVRRAPRPRRPGRLPVGARAGRATGVPPSERMRRAAPIDPRRCASRPAHVRGRPSWRCSSSRSRHGRSPSRAAYGWDRYSPAGRAAHQGVAGRPHRRAGCALLAAALGLVARLRPAWVLIMLPDRHRPGGDPGRVRPRPAPTTSSSCGGHLAST